MGRCSFQPCWVFTMIHLAYPSFLEEQEKWNNEKEEENNQQKAVAKWRGRMHQHWWPNCLPV